ncbi:hypothetical protein [Alkalicoccus luteus]|uniref:hypothetical protein n=1 Tax=Alkalicoccus luteus TaxID=1237094 RepID=UPI0040342980
MLVSALIIAGFVLIVLVLLKGLKLRRKEVQQYYGGMHLISLLVIAIAMITLIMWSGNDAQEMRPDEPM